MAFLVALHPCWGIQPCGVAELYLALASPCKMPIKHIKIYIYLWAVQGKKRDSIGDGRKDACGHFVDEVAG